MTTRVAVRPVRLTDPPAVASAPTRVLPVATSPVRRLIARLPVGWPLKYLLLGFPLWWVLGLNTLIFPMMALPMAWQLLGMWRQRTLRMPPAMVLWWLFLAWQVIGLALIQASPPGTHPGSESGRLISTVFTMVEYAGVTITMIYAGNLRRDEVPQSAIARWMGWFFLTVCAGGFLGLIAPSLSFRSVIEYVLPQGIAANAFVKALVHPVAAQVQDVIGTGDGRPSAPFGYTNSWGNALSILLVWFVAAWVVPAVGKRRLAYAAVVAASVVPIILSLNRGLWIGVAFTVVWILGRMLFQGHIGLVLSVVFAAALAGGVVAISPLHTVINERLQNGVSDDIRTFVAEKSIVAAQHSPIVGYGGNRHADGSSSSISVGPSPECPNCGEVATGSTGQFWFVLFNNGIVGTLLYLGFFVACLWIYWRQRGPIVEAALVTIALSYVYMFFYSALPVAPTLTGIAVAVLWRERDAGLERRAARDRHRIRLLPASA